jgi:hypothetical protein
LAFVAGDEIELDNGGAVSGVGEWDAEDGGVVLRLLEAVGGVFVGGLGLDNCEREIAGVAEEVVGALCLGGGGRLGRGRRYGPR